MPPLARDGQWLVQSHDFSSSLAVISRQGEQRVFDHPSATGTARVQAHFPGLGDLVFSMEEATGITGAARFAMWDASEGRLLATTERRFDYGPWDIAVVDEGLSQRRAILAVGDQEIKLSTLSSDGSIKDLGEIRLRDESGELNDYCLDPARAIWLAVIQGDMVWISDIVEGQVLPRRLLGRHKGDGLTCIPDRMGRYVLTVSRSGEIYLWDPSGQSEPSIFHLPSNVQPIRLSRDGYLFTASSRKNPGTDFSIWTISESGLHLVRRFDDLDVNFFAYDPNSARLVFRGPLPAHRLWSLAAPHGAEPIVLRRGPAGYTHNPNFSPDGQWLATADWSGLTMWPIARPYPVVIQLDVEPWSEGVAFAPNGQFMMVSAGNAVRSWPLVGPVPLADRVVFEVRGARDVEISPDSGLFAVVSGGCRRLVDRTGRRQHAGTRRLWFAEIRHWRRGIQS